MHTSLLFIAAVLALLAPVQADECTFGVSCNFGPTTINVGAHGGRSIFGANATEYGLFPVSISVAMIPPLDVPFSLSLLSDKSANAFLNHRTFLCLNARCQDTLTGLGAWPPIIDSSPQFLSGSYYVGLENKALISDGQFQVFFDMTSLYKLYPFRVPNRVSFSQYLTKTADQPSGCSSDMGKFMFATTPAGSWQPVYPDGQGNGNAWYLRWNGGLDKSSGLIQSGDLHMATVPTWSFYQHFNSSKLTITRKDTSRPCSAFYEGFDNPTH